MGESKEIFSEVASIRDELDEQGAVLDALVRASSAKQELLDHLRADPAASAVLLAVDGSRSQGAIASETKLSEATVSRRLSRLAEWGLVAISHKNGGNKVYHRTRLDRALRLSSQLAREAKAPNKPSGGSRQRKR